MRWDTVSVRVVVARSHVARADVLSWFNGIEFPALKISWSDVVFEFTMEPGLAVGLDEVAWPTARGWPAPTSGSRM
jgi:hypothetical protein